MQMPVPSSYNDITTSSELRDHLGAVWYQRTFFVPSSWREQRVFVRFGSVHYLAQVVIILYLINILSFQSFVFHRDFFLPIINMHVQYIYILLYICKILFKFPKKKKNYITIEF